MMISSPTIAPFSRSNASAATMFCMLLLMPFAFARIGEQNVLERALANCVNVINGTEGDDVITGTDCDDLIYGLGGNDVINGAGGNDSIFGGSGDDEIRGGSGSDHLDGGMGSDMISGGIGHDKITGGDGSDDLRGGSGNDSITGGSGDDTITGEAGGDFITGGIGSDLINGGDGSDKVSGGDGSDTISGASGEDTLDGDSGDDVIRGGSGSDYISGGAGSDLINVGTGSDVIEVVEGNDAISGGKYSEDSTITLRLEGGAAEVSGTTSPDTTYDAYFKVIGNGKVLEASTCNAMTNFDAELSITIESSGNSRLWIAGGGCSGSWVSYVGVTYYIRLTGYSWRGYEPDYGDYTLTVTSSDPDPESPPDNDQCADAALLELVDNVVQVNGTTRGAHHDGVKTCVVYDGSPTIYNTDNSGAGVWYKVVGTGKRMYALVVSTRWSITLYTGCDPLACVSKHGSYHDYPYTSLSWSSVAGKEYLIWIHGGALYSGDFTLTVRSTPDNNSCEKAISLDLVDNEVSVEGSGALGALWYTVEGTGHTMTAKTCINDRIMGAYFIVYTDCAGRASEVDTTGDWERGLECGTLITESWASEIGKVYYVLADGYSYEYGFDPTFTVTIESSLA